MGKLRLIGASLLAGLIAILYLLFTREKSEKLAVKKELDAAKEKVETYQQAATETNKQVERIEDAEKVRENVTKLSDGDVSNRLLKYSRNRSHKS